MNTLLIFFAFPIAVIIISAILEKILRNPVAVAALIFAIFLIITFAVFDETFLIATLAYTIIAFITALIVRFLKCKQQSENENNLCDLLAEIIRNNNGSNNENNLADTVEGLLSENVTTNTNSNVNSSNCCCNRYRRRW